MNWNEGPLAVLDLEATGVDTAEARIIEVGLISVGVDGEVESLVDELIDPGVPVPEKVTELTGITPTDIASEGCDPREVLERTRNEICALVEREVPIAIYNATYDWALLTRELTRHDLPALPDTPPAILIDPLVLDRYVDKYRRGSRSLAAVSSHYGIVLEDAHRAVGDAIATAGVARALTERYPQLSLGGGEIVELQIEAFEEWMNSFNEYLKKIDSTREHVKGTWPDGSVAGE